MTQKNPAGLLLGICSYSAFKMISILANGFFFCLYEITMRRSERQIINTGEIIALIDQSKVCRLGLSDGNLPYVVPLNFGYTFQDNTLTLFFHSAHEGKKIDILKNNPRACFEIDTRHELIEAATACGYGFAFASVIGFGSVEFITDTTEKICALNALMKHQTGKDIQHSYGEAELNAVCVYKLKVEEFTGKERTVKKVE
jgi:nitroimidazol reductase NimA-like FMN-containing flavoprotein (pyridoxamine 5'-phosphate oxidase superfamily)